MKMLAVMTSLFLRQHREATVAAPVTVLDVLQHIATRYEGHIQHTRVLPYAMMTDGQPRWRHPGRRWTWRLCLPRIVTRLRWHARHCQIARTAGNLQHAPLRVVHDLPAYYMSANHVICPWENKGKVMRILNEQYRERRTKPIDGIKIDLGNEWVLVLPDADRPFSTSSPNWSPPIRPRPWPRNMPVS